MDLCPCVIKYHRDDGEGSTLQELDRLSYTRRYIILVVESDSQVPNWVVYKLGTLLGSVGHRVKIHNITPVTGKERGEVEIKDYVVMQKPQVDKTISLSTRIPKSQIQDVQW